MDKLIDMKIKYKDGTYSDKIPIYVYAENVEWDSSHTLVDVLGDVDLNSSIQDQITCLFNNKMNATDLKNYVASQLNEDVSDWLSTYVNPVGSAVVVDSSLSISGAAADAKKTGDEFIQLKSALQSYEDIFTGDVDESVQNWLDAHPEATTSVEDHSLTYEKMVIGTLGYVTPEMFGAKGDGETDDTLAIQNAINSGKTVYIPAGVYIVSETIHISNYTNVFGDAAGWNSGGTCIKASTDFNGEYMFHVEKGDGDYCRSVSITDMNICCNYVTGGILAIHLYDASILKNLNITQVKADSIGLYIKYKGHVTQTLTCVNVICAADNNNAGSNTVPLISLERLQECTLINVKSFSYNNTSMELSGCQGIAMITCSTYDYSHNGVAYHICDFHSADATIADGTHNITMLSCLNEGNAGGLKIESDIDYTSNIMVINYTPKIHSQNSAVYIHGINNSRIQVAETRGYNTGVDYTLSNNYCCEVSVAIRDVKAVTTDGTTDIKPISDWCIYFAGSNKNGKTIPIPQYTFDGMKIVVKSDGNVYDARINLPGNTNLGVSKLSFSYFTKLVIERINEIFIVTECDGTIIDLDNNEILVQPNKKYLKLSSPTYMSPNYESNVYFTNEGLSTDATIKCGAYFTHKKIIVSSANNNTITVQLLGGITLIDGSTTSIVVSGGETKTIETISRSIASVY